jgi:Zn-dependent M32 family carboxypeptidase
MGIEENRERFLAWQNRLSAYKMALTLIEIDATERPLNAGAEYRGEKAAILSGEYMRVLKEEGIEDVWQTYVELLQAQDYFRKTANRTISEGCKIAFTKNLTDAQKKEYEEGGVCYVK